MYVLVPIALKPPRKCNKARNIGFAVKSPQAHIFSEPGLNVFSYSCLCEFDLDSMLI